MVYSGHTRISRGRCILSCEDITLSMYSVIRGYHVVGNILSYEDIMLSDVFCHMRDWFLDNLLSQFIDDFCHGFVELSDGMHEHK